MLFYEIYEENDLILMNKRQKIEIIFNYCDYNLIMIIVYIINIFGCYFFKIEFDFFVFLEFN